MSTDAPNAVNQEAGDSSQLAEGIHEGKPENTLSDAAAHHQSMVSQVAKPPFMKLGNPGPMGLLGFALTTFVLGLYECGAGLPHSNPEGNVGPNQAAFGLAIFMGGFAQFVAGCFEFRVGNTFGYTVHCSYGAFWLSYAMFLVPSLDIEGAYAALRTNIAILSVFFFLSLAYLFLSIANFVATEHPTQSVRLNQTGGALAVVCAFAAFYAGASGLMVPETTMIRFPLGQIPVSRA